MLEYFAIKKYKSHKAAKKTREEEEAAAEANTKPGVEDDSENETPPPLPMRPVLDRSDESFLESILSEDNPAPPQKEQLDIDWPSDVSSLSGAEESSEEDDKKGKEKSKKKDSKGKEKEKTGKLSHLFHRNRKHGETLAPSDATTEDDEVKREEKDISRTLDRLNLAAYNNKVVSLSEDSAQMLGKFTQIFKDLANGVPTAYDDLVKLISDRDGTINRGFEKLPSSMKKIVTQLPEKLTSTIAPEVLAAAAKSQGLETSAEGGIKEAAQKMFMPQNLLELVTKPGALVGMLRAIVSTLQTRWPAFLGVNVLWSVALLLLMFVLWYCHKRGREVRLENEKAGEAADGEERIEELPDDPALPAPPSGEDGAGPSTRGDA